MKNKVFNIIVASLLSINTFSLQAKDSTQENPDYDSVMMEARKFCQQSDDPTIIQMAKRAGYDFKKLCASVNQLSLDKEQLDEDKISQRSPELPKDPPLEEQQQTDTKVQEDTADLDTIKPLNPQLKLYGYDLFAGEPASFQPNVNVPIEPDYLLGPGDELKIQFYGKVNDFFEQTIQRDGSISFPKIGPLGVAGMTFIEVKQLINRKVAEEYIGVKVSLSLGALRSIPVFVFGEAYKPGRYTVPSLSTITNVLYLSGGVSDIASLREIQLKRDGKVIAELDLYDLLLKGDRSQDTRLQAGDTIFIPTIGQTAGIEGQVRRPAIFEVKGRPTVRKLIDLAGGLLPKAFKAKARIKRVDRMGFMTVVDVDLKNNKGLDSPIRNGDLLVIDEVPEESNSTVKLSGNIYHPGEFSWSKGLKVKDLIPDADSFMPNTDLNFALLRRELRPSGKITTLFVDLAEIMESDQSDSNYSLLPRDELIVFANQSDRAEELSSLIQELAQQARIDEEAKVVSIYGAVQSPGNYPMTEQMSLLQLLAAAGGLREQAYRKAVEITRSDFSSGEKVGLSHQSINLVSILSGEQQDVVLHSYDKVNIRNLPEYRQQMTVTLSGEVLLPGEYTFVHGETLGNVIIRAGGLTPSAHNDAAVFTRETLRQREIQKIDDLRDQIKADIAAINVQDGQNLGADSERLLLGKLDRSKASGRLVINLDSIISGNAQDVILQNGDHLMIPEFHQEVSVIGEVPWPSTHQHDKKLSLTDYLNLAGGAKISADKGRIYVVKVNGSVQIAKGMGWRAGSLKIEPGDTVVVPMDMDRSPALKLWTEVSQVIYQLSLGAAAIKSL